MTTFTTYRNCRHALFGLGALTACAFAFGGTPVLAEGDLSAAQRQISVVETPKSDFSVDGWVDRKSGKYQMGDTVEVYVRTSKDAYVTVFNVDAKGKTTMIFPNEFAKDNMVKADTVTTIPAKDAKFQLKVGGPEGTNLIKVLASTKKKSFEDAIVFAFNNGFGSYEGKPEKLAAELRSVIAEPAKDMEWASEDISFVVEKK